MDQAIGHQWRNQTKLKALYPDEEYYKLIDQATQVHFEGFWNYDHLKEVKETKIDQFKNLIEGIRKNPFSRRHVVSLWNPADVDDCVLPPCHGDVIQFIVDNNMGLHCLQYQRSADMAIGYCPWQYAMLTQIVGKLTNTIPTSLSCTVGSAHIYLNQQDAIKEQLSRTPSDVTPRFNIKKDIKTIEDVEQMTVDDVEVLDYNHQAFIKFPIAV